MQTQKNKMEQNLHFFIIFFFSFSFHSIIKIIEKSKKKKNMKNSKIEVMKKEAEDEEANTKEKE